MIDTKTVEQTRNTDMIVFFEKHCCFTFKTQRGAYRCLQHPSLVVKHDRSQWYWHSKCIGGYGAIDYLMKIENMLFRESIEILKEHFKTLLLPRKNVTSEQKKELFLPEKARTMANLRYYLCQKRGIENDIVNIFIRKGMLYEDIRGNCIFVGFDDRGKARFACVRGTRIDRVFRMDCIGSDKRYGFNITFPSSDQLYIYESAIDLMSHASLENAAMGNSDAWKQHNRLSLAGTSDKALLFFLNKHKAIKELIFCLDNDPTGREASVSMAKNYTEKGYNTRIELPSGKDYNEDLLTSFAGGNINYEKM